MEMIDVYLEWSNPEMDFIYKNIVVFRSSIAIDPNNLPDPIKVLDKKVENYTDTMVPLDVIPNYAVGCLLYNGDVVLSNLIDVEYIIKITNEDAVDAGGYIQFDIFGFGNKNGQTIDLGLSAEVPESLSSDDLESSRLISTFVGNRSTGTVRVKDNPTSSGGGITPFLFSSENRIFRSRNQIELNFRPFFHRFTNAGATGSIGPSLSQCINSYSDEVWATDTSQFTVDNGIQIWTVPSTGIYRITAAGAEGGNNDDVSNYGGPGRGALVQSVFSLTRGERIQIVVGQKGENGSRTGGGGGGGSYVVSESNNPLLVAGGGGGENNGSDRHLDGFASDYRGEGGGVLGHGNKGAGGGGFISNGTNAEGKAGQSFINGSQGGIGGGGGGNGGFGGGGGAGRFGSQGGGGGYAGGVGADGPFTNSSFHSGNGPYQKYSSTSFSSEEFTVQKNGGNSGDGYVEIKKI